MIARRFISIRLSRTFYIQPWKYWPRETRSRLLNASRHGAVGGKLRRQRLGEGRHHARGTDRWLDAFQIAGGCGDPTTPLPGNRGALTLFRPPTAFHRGWIIDDRHHRRASYVTGVTLSVDCDRLRRFVIIWTGLKKRNLKVCFILGIFYRVFYLECCFFFPFSLYFCMNIRDTSIRDV